MEALETIRDGEAVVPGLRFFRRVGYLAAELHYSANPEHRDPAWKADAKVGMETALWDREMEIRWDAMSGTRVYPMFDDALHVRHVAPEPDWTRYRTMDHGVRSPTVCLWFAVPPPREPWKTHDLYAYREYYERNRTIAQNCLGIAARQQPYEPAPLRTYIDPSTGRRDDVTGMSLLEEYRRNGISALPADNAKDAGREVVKAYLVSSLARHCLASGRPHRFLEGASPAQLTVMARHPAVYFDPSMTETAREMATLRYRDRKTRQDLNQREVEEDKDDHAPDACRYLLVARPQWWRPEVPRAQEKWGARVCRKLEEEAAERSQRGRGAIVLT